KHRFTLTADGEPGLHYLCAGYKNFFRHIRKYLRAMTTLIENDLPVATVMQAIDGPLIITRTPAARE
ncbi:MAG: anaerobic sulfatase maturase, partial [Burkholderiaceae bacterium]